MVLSKQVGSMNTKVLTDFEGTTVVESSKLAEGPICVVAFPSVCSVFSSSGHRKLTQGTIFAARPLVNSSTATMLMSRRSIKFYFPGTSNRGLKYKKQSPSA